MLVFIVAAHPDSTFDVALCGLVQPVTSTPESLLAEVLRILKPSGKLILVEPAAGDVNSVSAKLKLTGYVDIKQVSIINILGYNNNNKVCI